MSLKDASGTVIGMADLETADTFDADGATIFAAKQCAYTGVFKGVELDSTAYTLEIPSLGEALFSAEDIRDGIDLEREDGLGNIEGQAVSFVARNSVYQMESDKQPLSVVKASDNMTAD